MECQFENKITVERESMKGIVKMTCEGERQASENCRVKGKGKKPD